MKREPGQPFQYRCVITRVSNEWWKWEVEHGLWRMGRRSSPGYYAWYPIAGGHERSRDAAEIAARVNSDEQRNKELWRHQREVIAL